MNFGRTVDTRIGSFFMNGFKRRPNANVYYSPGVDRLFAVDNFDPYTSMEIAQILSSKMPAIAVLILHKDEVVGVNNGNCTNYTIKNKNPIPGQAALLFSRQMPVVRKLDGPQLIQVEDFPPDYFYNENLNTFVLFCEYAKFVIRAWHAAKICDLTHNLLPMNIYDTFLNDVKPAGWATPADNANGSSQVGITTEIKRILYFSDNIDDALEQLAQMWRDNNTPLTLHWRKQFYALLEEVEEPTDLKQSKLNLDNYSGYLL
jgi:hypothetical protein